VEFFLPRYIGLCNLVFFVLSRNIPIFLCTYLSYFILPQGDHLCVLNRFSWCDFRLHDLFLQCRLLLFVALYWEISGRPSRIFLQLSKFTETFILLKFLVACRERLDSIFNSILLSADLICLLIFSIYCINLILSFI